MILPFKSTVKSSDFSPSQMDDFRDLSFIAFYNLFGTLPFTQVPDRDRLRKMNWNTEGIDKMGEEESTDYIIFGTFSLKGSAAEPEVVVNLKVWNKDKKLVFQRTYTTHLDLDIFDTLDTMVLDTLEASFNIKAQIATLEFNNFSVPQDQYKLYINSKEIADVQGSDFNLSLKIIADTEYHILLERTKDNVAVLSEKVKLKKGESHLVNYQARGNVKIQKILYKEKQKTYKVLLNGDEVAEGSELSNLNAGIPYNLMVIDNLNVIQDKHSFSLSDGGMVSIQPMINWGGTVHFRSFFLGGSIAGVGLDLHLSRPLWLGLSTGITYVSKPSGTSNVNIFAVNPSLELGYYLKGHMNTSFRLGAGLQLGSMLAFPAPAWELIAPGESRFSLVPGVFVDVEWKNLFARLILLADFSAAQPWGFYPLIGFKI